MATADAATCLRISPCSLAYRSEYGGSEDDEGEDYTLHEYTKIGLDRFRDSTLGGNEAGVEKVLNSVPIVGLDHQSSTDIENPNQQIKEEVIDLSATVGNEISDTTRKNYIGQWRRFCTWAIAKNTGVLPADSTQVAAYLTERFERQGHRPATLSTAAAAIAFVHKAAGLDDPCDSSEVKRALKCAIRKAGSLQRQAKALTAESMARISATACIPRRGRGGKIESPGTARLRGRTDIAIISLMRDAMLRVSEAAALKWADIEDKADGSGRLLIRRSKTDPVGEGAIAFVSYQTMEALSSIRASATVSDSIFDLSPNQISNRIKRAALEAGLGEGFSGHSPRVGMACDLASVGTELPSLMVAGRWSSPRMPALYVRNEAASRGAVAKYYKTLSQRF